MRSIGEAVCVMPKLVFNLATLGKTNTGQDGQHTGFSAASGAASPGLEDSDTASNGSNLRQITMHKMSNGS